MKTVLAILCIISHHGIRDGMQRERPASKEVERSEVIVVDIVAHILHFRALANDTRGS